MINKNKVKNILITRTDSLGDVILTLPLLSETKRIFEDSKISFLVKENVKDLLVNYSGIDELIPEESIPGFFGKYKFLKSKKVNLVINVKPRFDLALLFFLLRVNYRIGTAYRWYSFLYNNKVYEHRKISDKHESDYNLNLLKNFVSDVKVEKEFYFNYSDGERNALNLKLNLLLDKNFIIVHPGSRGSSHDLPLERFSEFINRLLTQYDGYIVFTGIESERSLLNTLRNTIREDLKHRIVNLCSTLNLRELVILIDNSRIFVSNSTGPIHIAGALNKNIIGFYPNKKPVNETRWRPLSKYSIIITPKGNSNDMSSIEIDEIIDAARNFLGNKSCLN